MIAEFNPFPPRSSFLLHTLKTMGRPSLLNMPNISTGKPEVMHYYSCSFPPDNRCFCGLLIQIYKSSHSICLKKAFVVETIHKRVQHPLVPQPLPRSPHLTGMLSNPPNLSRDLACLPSLLPKRKPRKAALQLRCFSSRKALSSSLRLTSESI